MYYADSDILTVVIAMITIAAGVYSSVAKKKKSNLNGKGSENDLSGEDKKGILEKIFVTEEEIDEEADLFDAIFGIKKDVEEVEPVEEMPQEEMLQEEMFQEEMFQEEMFQEEMFQEEMFQEEMFQEIESADIEVVPVVEEGIRQTETAGAKEESVQIVQPQEAEEQQPEGLKERLKKSPKDMILFAEILKPKFKEF